MTLVGTIIETDDRIAMIADPNGKVDIKRVGESLELSPSGVVVEQIDSDRVTLRYNGAEAIVKLQKKFKSSGGGGGNNRPGRNRRRN